ncbi:ubiquinol-cytochrome c reductase iron-sulfur subunit [Sinimarinibacterium flocculans]|uniref:QcrA and Rieske domain-containing protein n=1 Tax=Sinimarinibacterium flocculans TaxID=985250 RepID=UPI0024911A82|nr:Rieske (2Fe-2S) protein [Sinimarinibacterium flocculans]
MSVQRERGCGCGDAVDGSRRKALGSVLAMALSPLVTSASAAVEGRSKQPAIGDRLAFMLGERKDQPIGPADVKLGDAPTLAYPIDGNSGEVLASRAGMVVVVRLPLEEMSEETRAQSADGVVAFSALCTHYGCPITVRDPSQSKLVCNCHGSVFDPGNRGAVLDGPATRRLAMLPLAIDGDVLVVAGALDGPIGPPT